MKNDFEKTLKATVEVLVDSFAKNRRKTEPYKDLFKAGNTFTGLLNNLNLKMVEHVLDASDVLEKTHNVIISKEIYNFLLALPYLASELEKNVKDSEGYVCCIDKTFFILSEELKKLVENAKKIESQQMIENNK